ncbi:MAG TPA: class I SAM-dependent methyltransferase [Solirubrobacteraceae bacterium]|nr:class I SAM-dependent methyltransferase [Solirubrobacteraceae bacterium]
MSTREFYEAGYAVADPRGGRWRAIGARSKAAHVEALTARAGLTPRTVVEIGCGDGSVLAELAARGWVVDGFELAENAAAAARERGIARRVERFDGEHVPAETDEYDLAVLSHVLEHVPDPLPLLAEAARVAPSVLVEVPLEDNRSARRPAKKRLSEEAGHLHAFSRARVLRLVREANLHPRAEMTDPLPYEHHAFSAGALRGGAKWLTRAALHRAGVAERLITLHYAVLATRA